MADDKKCCGNCASCESPFKLQSMVCASQLSLYNMKMLETAMSLLEELTKKVEELNERVSTLTQGVAMTPEKPVRKKKAQGEGGAENRPSK